MEKSYFCYMLKSEVANRIYIGYTINFNRRIRQHNGLICGGAKRTRAHRPWIPFCLISGFTDSKTAKSFEYWLQHQKNRKKKGQLAEDFYVDRLINVYNNPNKVWPNLVVTWYTSEYGILCYGIKNLYAKI